MQGIHARVRNVNIHILNCNIRNKTPCSEILIPWNGVKYKKRWSKAAICISIYDKKMYNLKRKKSFALCGVLLNTQDS